MAELVEIIGVTHNPFLSRMLAADDGSDPVLKVIAEDYALMRARLAEARPDVLVVIASDHLNQWFMDNMPAFLVGKSARAEGPFPHEQRGFGLAPYSAAVDTTLAKWFVAAGFNEGVDFAFSDEFLIDHAFTVPLHFVRPEMDLPIVPIWTNVMAPPLPPADRFYFVGGALARLIASAPSKQRIAVITSGHLAVEVGGPKPHTAGSTDELFDRNMMAFIEAGDVQSVLRDSTFERLLQAGNVTPGFLNYVMLLGVAEGRKPSAIALRFPQTTTAVYYMEWDHGSLSR
jgi:protocatechuate 4,5-dioxygenase, beta chain